MTELKPCPFCGGTANFGIREDSRDEDYIVYIVYCDVCEVTMACSTDDVFTGEEDFIDESGMVDLENCTDASKRAAIETVVESWNRRVE